MNPPRFETFSQISMIHSPYPSVSTQKSRGLHETEETEMVMHRGNKLIARIIDSSLVFLGILLTLYWFLSPSFNYPFWKGSLFILSGMTSFRLFQWLTNPHEVLEAWGLLEEQEAKDSRVP